MVLLERDTQSAPGKIRTCDLSLRRRALYPLSYGRRRPPDEGAFGDESLPPGGKTEAQRCEDGSRGSVRFAAKFLLGSAVGFWRCRRGLQAFPGVVVAVGLALAGLCPGSALAGTLTWGPAHAIGALPAGAPAGV